MVVDWGGPEAREIPVALDKVGLGSVEWMPPVTKQKTGKGVGRVRLVLVVAVVAVVGETGSLVVAAAAVAGADLGGVVGGAASAVEPLSELS
jgi:hypothetical protein